MLRKSILLLLYLCPPSQSKATMEDQDHHKHKQRKEGRGAKEKKRDKRAKEKGTRVERHNHRAFGVANVVRTKRTQQRNLDRSQKKEYVPLQEVGRVCVCNA